jgi:hypothetical protein
MAFLSQVRKAFSSIDVERSIVSIPPEERCESILGLATRQLKGMFIAFSKIA